MDFNELLNDIAKLEGLNLQSIRPGANITIEKVDLKQGKIIVINSSGKIFSRSIIEFQRIWKELLSEPAVRVEEVLRGSGSSRNQPETIFANLPYIEWLKITNKKHIAFVQKATHPYGTLKEMDDIKNGNISDDEIDMAKRTYINSLLTMLDNLSSITYIVSGFDILGRDNYLKRIKEVEKVTKEDIIKVADLIHMDTVFLLEEGDKVENNQD